MRWGQIGEHTETQDEGRKGIDEQISASDNGNLHKAPQLSY